MRRLVLTLALFTAVAPAVAQMAKVPGPVTDEPETSHSQHHGTWWVTKSRVYHEAYINGYKSGWHHALNGHTPLYAFQSNVIADGVDKFFADFRNRTITVDSAITYVTEQLNGADPDKLKAELLKLRAEAASKQSGEDQ